MGRKRKYSSEADRKAAQRRWSMEYYRRNRAVLQAKAWERYRKKKQMEIIVDLFNQHSGNVDELKRMALSAYLNGADVAKIQISLVDAEGFMEAFPVIGDDIIEISLEHPLTTTNIDETIHKQRFHLYDMQMIPSERKLAELDVSLKGDQAALANWEQYKKTNGIPTGSKEDEELMKKQYEVSLALQTKKKINDRLVNMGTPTDNQKLLQE